MKIQKVTLCEQIISAVVSNIETGEWELGMRLPGEADLAASFSVSRNVMREAVKILENFGILDSKNGIGTFIAINANENIQNMNFFYSLKEVNSVEEILEVRLMIEPTAAYFAAERIQEDGKEELFKILESLKRKYDDIPNYKDDFEVHIAIAHYSGNGLCQNFLVSLLNQLQNSLYSEFNKHSTRKVDEYNIASHIDILEAIIAHRPQLAKELMYEHLNRRIQLINPDFMTKPNGIKEPI